MFELLTVAVFVWLFWKTLRLTLRMAWGTARLIASVLFAIAVPLLALCLVFAGGIVLLVPLAVIGIAFGVVKACI